MNQSVDTTANGVFYCNGLQLLSNGPNRARRSVVTRRVVSDELAGTPDKKK
jgi:hypothetical protein